MDSFQAMLCDPAAFRQRLLIDCDGSAVPFRPDAWQLDDFLALDDAWKFAVGRWDGDAPPAVRRLWSERPRGHAKTSDLGIMATWALLFAPRPVVGIAAAGDKDQAALLRSSIATLARVNPWIGSILDVQQWRVVNPKTGAELTILSSDVATSFGQLPDFIIADEITHWPEGKGDALWHSIFSAVAKRANCLLGVIANAGFTEHFAWGVREKVKADPLWHFSHLDGPRASWITESRLAEQRRLLPAVVFDRLWNNIWASGLGDALQEADILASLTETEPLTGFEKDYVFFGGLDLSISRDASACVIVGRTQAGRLRLATVRAWTPPRGGKVDLPLIRDSVLSLSRQFPGVQIGYDVYQAELMRSDLDRAGVSMLPVSFAGKIAQEMASELLEAFASRRVGLYHDAALVDDLRRLRIKESVAGWRLDPPRTSTGHGDRGIAFAMALWTARQDTSFCGVWHLPPIPQGRDRSLTQELFETHADVFAPASLAPGDPVFQGWPSASEDRPL
jgi:phage terminase large subunit-like protein